MALCSRNRQFETTWDHWRPKLVSLGLNWAGWDAGLSKKIFMIGSMFEKDHVNRQLR